jgi:hypothetical protein
VPSEVRRKRTDQPLEPGSVPMEGQEMTIRIFKTEFQKVQGLTKYWFEVVDEESPHHGRASVAWSELHHFRRHVYRVRVNDETKNPRILEDLGEIVPDGPAVAD